MSMSHFIRFIIAVFCFQIIIAVFWFSNAETPFPC